MIKGRGIIYDAIHLGISRGKSMSVVKRFLSIKYNIKASTSVIKKRLTNLRQ